PVKLSESGTVRSASETTGLADPIKQLLARPRPRALVLQIARLHPSPHLLKRPLVSDVAADRPPSWQHAGRNCPRKQFAVSRRALEASVLDRTRQSVPGHL